MPAFLPVGHAWRDRLAELIRGTGRELLITAPYISQAGLEFVEAHATDDFRRSGKIVLLTDLSPLAVSQGATDPIAVRGLMDLAAGGSLHHLRRVHAKAYVSDGVRAIVSSGNLTAGGLYRNHEYSIAIDDGATVAMIRRDLDDYNVLGVTLDRPRLDRYCEATERLRSVDRAPPRVASAEDQQVQDAFRAAEDMLIGMKLGGGPVHRVFQEAIMYLLRRSGPLSTRELQPLIEEIHPELCDNTIDRVIEGVRFGKKWKHAVRTAQQHLKDRGRVGLIDGRWTILGEPRSSARL